MQKEVELTVNGKTLRGIYHIPEFSSNIPLMILFHGFTGLKSESHRIFVKLSRLLSQKGIGVLRFDFSGSGESDGDFDEMTFSSEVAEGGAILDYAVSLPAVDKSRIGLLGLSMGGAVAAIIAGKRSADIRTLVLWAPATAELMRRVFQIRVASAFRDESGRYDLDGLWLNPRFTEDLKQWDCISTVSNYNGKTLIIHGSEDVIVPVDIARQYQKVFSETARLEIIEGADHTFDRYDWEKAVLNKTVDFVLEEL